MTRQERAVIDTALAVVRAKETLLLVDSSPHPPTFEDAARRQLAIANATFHLSESEMNHACAIRDLLNEAKR